MSKLVVLTITLFSIVFLAGCGSNPQLEPRRGGNPSQIDLSGNWVLRGPIARRGDEEQTIVMPRGTHSNVTKSQRRASKQRANGTSLMVFLESGKSLKLTQTVYGLFISFDRAIVAEYNFGENIMVSVGPIEVQRVSGWDGPVFMAESMDEKGNVLTESWQLDEGGAVLRRTIVITEGEEQVYSAEQVFDRQ
jgi:hypothetical protein